ncbi:MAG: hypothetical protein RMA76_01215 [Deltaproteobacteria bacterium]|jgi:hypothetical protein
MKRSVLLPVAAFGLSFVTALPMIADAYIGRAGQACRPIDDTPDVTQAATGWRNLGSIQRVIICPIDSNGASIQSLWMTVLDNNSSQEVYAAATWRSWSGYSGGSSFLSPVTSAGYTGTGSWSVNQVHVDVLNNASYSGYRMLYVYLQPYTAFYGIEIF